MRTRAFAAVLLAAVLGACEAGPEQPVAPPETAFETAPFRARSDQLVAENTGLSAPDRVFFAFDSAKLSRSAISTLQQQATWMEEHPEALFMLAGHTDERGTREHNLALGERRAAAVRDYLMGLGIAPGRLQVTSYGKERPAVVGSTEPAWSLNRRVETLIDE
jgi:peptidoglycan-associated lipoprotein